MGLREDNQCCIIPVLDVYTLGFLVFRRDPHEMIVALESEVDVYQPIAPFSQRMIVHLKLFEDDDTETDTRNAQRA